MNCPRCKAQEKYIIPIKYGEPRTEQLEAEKRGEIMIGGCDFSKDSPRNYCTKCKSKFNNEPTLE